MKSFRASLLAFLALLFLVQTTPAQAGWLGVKGGKTAPVVTLNDLAVSDPSGPAGTSGSSSISNATLGSTLSLSTNPSSLFSINSGTRTLSWTSSVTATTYSVGIDETLSGASNSPKTNTIPITFAAASGYVTGTSIAKAGAAQHPTLLDNNAATNETGEAIPNRPSWNVAGVDYRVGPSDSQSYANISTITSLSCIDDGVLHGYSPSNHRIYIQHRPCTIDGFDLQDFTIDTQYADGTGLILIQNNKYLATDAYPGQFYYASAYDANQDVTIQFNLIDGAYKRDVVQPDGFDGLIGPGAGNTLIQMNWIKRIPDDGIHVRTYNGVQSVESRWNVFEGIGGDWEAHGDIIQVNMSGNGGYPFKNIHHHGNTIYQPCADAVTHLPSAMNTDFRAGDGHTGTDMTDPAWDHETVISTCLNHAGSDGGVQVNNFPGVINLEQVGDSTTVGTNSITNWQVDYNYFYGSPGAPYDTCCDRTIFNIYSNTHRANVTYTIGTHNVKMWSGAAWATVLPHD